MIDRAEIEFTLAMAEKGIRAEAPAKAMEELCRVYLRYTWLRRIAPIDWPARLYADPDLDEDGFDAVVDAAMAEDDNEYG